MSEWNLSRGKLSFPRKGPTGGEVEVLRVPVGGGVGLGGQTKKDLALCTTSDGWEDFREGASMLGLFLGA